MKKFTSLVIVLVFLFALMMPSNMALAQATEEQKAIEASEICISKDKAIEIVKKAFLFQ